MEEKLTLSGNLKLDNSSYNNPYFTAGAEGINELTALSGRFYIYGAIDLKLWSKKFKLTIWEEPGFKFTNSLFSLKTTQRTEKKHELCWR